MALKLSRLPDRNPVRLVLMLPPQLNADLLAYAKAYEAQYGANEPLPELVLGMLATFLASDRAFVRLRQKSNGSN